jgi:hypothetical protein
MAWLAYKGCRLDSPDGPAVVRRGSDGSFYEEYWRNGKLHREDGPAFVRRGSDGVKEQRYYKGWRA